MIRALSAACVFLWLATSTGAHGQQFSMSVGLTTGITSTHTMDNGIARDVRYKPYYGLKYAPIGAMFSFNYEYVGILLTPSLINIGQDAYVLNPTDGDIGDRSYNLRYLNVPVGLKVYFVNRPYLKISAVGSLSGAILLKGSETVSHRESIMTFPRDVYPILPESYNIEYDGVAAPAVDSYVIAGKDDFKSFQVFAGAGLQTDWDVSNHWRVVFDLRVNYGLFDPRTSAYIDRVNAHETLYDIPGKRHDVFAQLSVGIARYIDLEKRDIEQKKKLKSGKKGYRPQTGSYPKPRSTKPGNK